MTKIQPQNLTAQLHYRGRGNPPNTQPVSAISNCFPGLEMDFRAIWRRMFVGIVIVENNNYVLEAEDPRLAGSGSSSPAADRRIPDRRGDQWNRQSRL
jgi:hypothetical protein